MQGQAPAKSTKMQPRQRAVYENCRVLDIHGSLLFRCNRRRLDWYTSRQLAQQIDSTTIQLLFANRGNGRKDSPFYLQELANRCVVCGGTSQLTMHHVVPEQYRRFMDVAVKSRSSYDVLPVCVACHDTYESTSARAFRSHLAGCFGAPVAGVGWVDRPELARAARAASALVRHGARIPEERRCALRAVVRDVVREHARLFSDGVCGAACGDGPVDEAVACALAAVKTRVRGPRFREHGELVVAGLGGARREGMCAECAALAAGGVGALVRAWRRNFVEGARPRFLPDHWVVDYPVCCK